MKTYVLIMVLSAADGVTTITQEFTSEKTCRLAMDKIIADKLSGGYSVRSANCFEK